MLVKDLMWKDPVIVSPEATLKEAAETMREVGCGVLPVGQDIGKIEGVITDRDIVIRAVAQGKEPESELVKDYMTRDVVSCGENATILAASEMMKGNNIGRLCVTDNDEKLIGILSFGHIMRNDADAVELAEAVMSVTNHNGDARPG